MVATLVLPVVPAVAVGGHSGRDGTVIDLVPLNVAIHSGHIERCVARLHRRLNNLP